MYAGFQLEIEFHAWVSPAFTLDLLNFFQVGTVNLAVVLRFPRLDEPGIDPLTFLQVTVLLDELPRRLGKSDGLKAPHIFCAAIAASIQNVDINESVLPEVQKVPLEPPIVAGVERLRNEAEHLRVGVGRVEHVAQLLTE